MISDEMNCDGWRRETETRCRCIAGGLKGLIGAQVASPPPPNYALKSLAGGKKICYPNKAKLNLQYLD